MRNFCAWLIIVIWFGPIRIWNSLVKLNQLKIRIFFFLWDFGESSVAIIQRRIFWCQQKNRDNDSKSRQVCSNYSNCMLKERTTLTDSPHKFPSLRNVNVMWPTPNPSCFAAAFTTGCSCTLIVNTWLVSDKGRGLILQSMVLISIKIWPLGEIVLTCWTPCIFLGFRFTVEIHVVLWECYYELQTTKLNWNFISVLCM